MKNNKIPIEFQISFLDGKMERISDTISRTRAKIFYSGHNRNGGYITEEFAEKLLSTLEYAPVKGSYAAEKADFEGHNEDSESERIYGFVPSPANFSWETHLDHDGVERTYACSDVLLWDKVYKESNEVVGKSQSMELYPPSIEGDWGIVDGRKAFIYDKASFLGLQILGDEITPAFEGAAFYSKDFLANFNHTYQVLSDQLDRMKELTKKGGKDNMLFAKINLALAAAGHEGLEVTEDRGEFAVAKKEDKTFKVFYEKDEEKITISKVEEFHLIEVSSNEKEALEKVREELGDFSKVVEEIEKLKEENENFSTKVVELEGNKTTLELEQENFTKKITKFEEQEATLNAKVLELENENKELIEFKLEIERQEKEKIFTKYDKFLDTETVKNYRANLSEYSVEELERDLSYELVKSTPSLFSEDADQGYFKKDEDTGGKDRITQILEKYKK